MGIPWKSPATRTHAEEPPNVETLPHSLRESFVTPVEHFFVRSHGTMPEVNSKDYSLTVSGLVDKTLSFSLKELKSRFSEKELTATLHCAGNRRSELMQVHPIPGETPWGLGAIGNARWTGVSLRDLLLEAGIADEARHVAFNGLDEASAGGGTTNFGGSIPLEKALGEDVILAYEMNGEPLTTAHGHPLRAVVAGYIGARSVKWLSGIEVRREPSDNYFQARDYRLYPGDREPGEQRPEEGEELGDLYVNSVICRPVEGELVSRRPVKMAGYAITGTGREVESVEVSADGGETWERASLAESGGPESWVFWEALVEPANGQPEARLAARARDTSGEVQPFSLSQTWNPKGYVNNAYHQVNVRLSGS